ncbi:imidazolonepropionase-like domain-containing protein [Teichococcus aestuarii]
MSGFDHVWLNAHLATMDGPAEAPLGIVEDGAIATQGGRIAWVGKRADLPAHEAPVTDCAGAWVLPGLVDCHTHLVFGGNRAGEFEQRLEGATYEEIARAGVASSPASAPRARPAKAPCWKPPCPGCKG